MVANLVVNSKLSKKFAGFLIGAGGYGPDICNGVKWIGSGFSQINNRCYKDDTIIPIPKDSPPIAIFATKWDIITPTRFALNFYKNAKCVGAPVYRVGRKCVSFPLHTTGHYFPDKLCPGVLGEAADWLYENHL